MIAFNAHFDGKVLVPDEPLNLVPNEKVRITIEKVDAELGTPLTGKRLLGQQPGVVTYIAPDFNDPLSDSFWLAQDDTTDG